MKKLILHIVVLALFASCESKHEEPAKVESNKESEQETKIDTAKLFDSVKTHEVKPAAEDKDKPDEPIQTESKPAEPKPQTEPAKLKSISELWNTYKSAKQKVNDALEADNLDETIKYLKIAGEAAQDLGRPGIAAWQFNNIGHYSIEKFKKETNYDNRMRELATMESGDEKVTYLDETKRLLDLYYPLLLRAEKYLERAQIIDDELEKSRRTEVIERNVEFIAWVKDFLGK